MVSVESVKQIETKTTYWLLFEARVEGVARDMCATRLRPETLVAKSKLVINTCMWAENAAHSWLTYCAAPREISTTCRKLLHGPGARKKKIQEAFRGGPRLGFALAASCSGMSLGVQVCGKITRST